jgi:NAD-dependent DNA ligase
MFKRYSLPIILKGLNNRTFFFSVILQLKTRPQAEKMVIDNGGQVRKSVSSTTDFLLVGPHLKNGKPSSMGSEYKKAESSSRTQILSEDEFLKLIVPF